MTATNTLEALQFCVICLNQILDFPLSTNDRVFTEETITTVRNLAAAAKYHRKKKNYGVIGGSVAGIVGGAMSVAGAALLPFTFGTSITLLISGGVIGLTGATVNIGFSVEKVIGDKARVKQFKPVLEMFVKLHKHFANATVTIHLLLKFLKSRMKSDLCLRPLGNDEVKQMTKMENEINQLYRSGRNDMNIHQQFVRVDLCVQNIVTKMGDMLKHMLTVKDIADFAAVEKKAEKASFDNLVHAIPVPNFDVDDITFRVFVRRYLAADTDVPAVNSVAPLEEAGRAVGKTAVGGGTVAARAALRAAYVGDDLSKVGGALARVASGVSAASIVLSGVGIGIDLAFLGHAIHDLVQISNNEDRRRNNSREPNGAGSNRANSRDFSELLLDLVESMILVNQIYRAA